MCGYPTTKSIVLGKRLNQSQGKSPKNKVGITTTILKCINCGLIFSNPQPIPIDVQMHYGVMPESYWDSNYFKILENDSFAIIESLKSYLYFNVGMKSLDVGAGIGKAMIKYAEAGLDAYGIEPSKPFYERAVSFSKISLDKIKCKMIENAEYPDNYFDFISFDVVLEHLYNPSESIIKALKWLKPSGIIYIAVPSSKWLTSKIVNLFYKLTFSDYVANLSPMHEPYHLFEFDIKSFQEHSIHFNYEILHHEYSVCQTYLPKIANFILKPYMKHTNTGMELIIWIRKK